MTANPPTHSETWHLFHRLWTKAVGTRNYDRAEWIEMETVILAFEKPPDAPER